MIFFWSLPLNFLVLLVLDTPEVPEPLLSSCLASVEQEASM